MIHFAALKKKHIFRRMKIKYPLLIDGGLSNVLEAQGCDLNNSLWTAHLLEHKPEAIIQAHYTYLKAGANCITSASYQASIAGFIDSGYTKDEAAHLMLKSIRLAETAIGLAKTADLWQERPLLAASIGPYGAYLADGSEYRGDYGVSDETLRHFHEPRIELLDQSSADLLAIETIPSWQEAKVLAEILTQVEKPAWISFSCQNGQKLHDGTPIIKVAALFKDHPKVFAIGVNCTHPKYISDLIIKLKSVVGDKKIVIYPNSGEAYHAYTKTWMGISDPIAYVEMAKEWLELGADMIGGCCRIGPEHIKGIQQLLKRTVIK